MRILSWNVAGIRAMLKKNAFHDCILNSNNDILCFQETKAEELQVELTQEIKTNYPYRYWNSTNGTSQRKGLSGTSIWCIYPPIKKIETPDFDTEGRILALEFEKFILINVYVPNSQKLDSPRYYFRINWNNNFSNFVKLLQEFKPVIICGDMNVAHKEIDINNPKQKKNKVPGFFDIERENFTLLLENNKLIDIYRYINNNKHMSTYWSNFLKADRNSENGWRIDYFLVSENILHNNNLNCNILLDILGSDHCPLLFEIN